MSWKFKSLLYRSFKKYLVIQQDISCVSTSKISLWFGSTKAFHGCQLYLNWITSWKLQRGFLEFVSNFWCWSRFYYLRWDRHDNILIFFFFFKGLAAFFKIPPRECSLVGNILLSWKNVLASSVTPQMRVIFFSLNLIKEKGNKNFKEGGEKLYFVLIPEPIVLLLF